MTINIRGLILICVCLPAFHIKAQTVADPALLAQINRIEAIDNHAHPLKYVAPGEKPDDEFDALPLDAIEAFPLPLRLSPANPEFIRAWHDLYGYTFNDMNPAHVAELMKVKQNVIRARGAAFPAWVLDRLNIETMFGNRVAVGPGLVGTRFRLVAFD